MRRATGGKRTQVYTRAIAILLLPEPGPDADRSMRGRGQGDQTSYRQDTDQNNLHGKLLQRKQRRSYRVPFLIPPIYNFCGITTQYIS